MALKDVQLSILTFPQRFRRGALECRVLLLPAYDPLTPGAVPDLPRFAGTDWPLRAVVVPGSEALPLPSPGPDALTRPFTAAAPGQAVSLFAALKAEFKIGLAPADPPAKRLSRLGDSSIRKHLPESYTGAFPFERPADGTSTGKEFACALRDEEPARSGDPKPPAGLSWGAALSFALRQPRLAEALGLIHDLTIRVRPAGLLATGGWVYMDLDPAGGLSPGPDRVRSYAALLPALPTAAGKGAGRRLFAAVLFPVVAAPAKLDDPLSEALSYTDGFARIVHASQALTADAASSGHNELKPATDAGIDLGWDDEQVTLWLNRQLDALRARLGGPPAVEAPLGVSGYRIDVRLPEIPGLDTWRSLCRAVSAGPDGAPAPLRFPPDSDPALFNESFDGELAVEPTPVRALHAQSRAAWLPQHFARWQGGSLVVADRTLLALAGETPGDAAGAPLAVPASTYAPAGEAVPLRYGRLYEFRCRLADLTGRGPEVGEEAIHPGPVPAAKVRFLRHVPPKPVRATTNVPPRLDGEPNRAPGAATVITDIDVRRPLIGYPELVFAGIDDPAVVTALLAAAPGARSRRDAVGVADPDVTHLRIEVQVRALAHDPGPADQRDGDYLVLYKIQTAFPPFDPAAVLEPGTPLSLRLRYEDTANVFDLASPGDEATELPVPRARDVRLRLTPWCADKPDYFGPSVQEGLTVDLATRQDAEDESGLVLAASPQDQLQAILLQPGADLVQRLTDHLGLRAKGLALSARPGQRVVFGASAAFRHTLSGDHGEITFASQADLLSRWIAVVQIDLDRDWSWDGLADTGIEVSRSDAAGETPRTVGQIRVPFVAAPAAVAAADGVSDKDRRARTRLVFFDAVDPNPPAGAFPSQPTPSWQLTPHLRGATPATAGPVLSIELPVAVPPRQTPRLVAAGLALSPYEFDEKGYQETLPRRRALWIELEEPVADPNDALFARVLAYGPDPLLSGSITHRLAPQEGPPPASAPDVFAFVRDSLPKPPDPPPLAIDPEPIRIIHSGQPEDRSGLDARDLLVAAEPVSGEAKPRHFLVPLPHGVDPDAPEMFGFWTYELCIGHAAIWSTAQARYGRVLEVRGVQHPAPALRCSAFRVRPAPDDPPAVRPRIVVTAPHATAVFADRRLTDPREGDPRTRLWVLLYAQVTQADGASRRNILLGHTLAAPRIDMQRGSLPPSPRDVIGVAGFDEEAVARTLQDLALPSDAPLSVLTVELLPGDGLTLSKHQFTDRLALWSNVDRPESSVLGALFGGQASDPLGRDLGTMASRRILRCSPLTPVAPAC